MGLEDINPCGSVLSTPLVIFISNFKVLYFIVYILWTIEKFNFFYCDSISDYIVTVIWGL